MIQEQEHQTRKFKHPMHHTRQSVDEQPRAPWLCYCTLDPRATGTDAIRCEVPLTLDSVHTNVRQGREAAPAGAAPAPAKPSPGLVRSLGVVDALGGLGIGGLLPGVDSAVGGIPIVGAPVAGVLTGADNTVGVTALLSPKDNPTFNATGLTSTDLSSASASTNVSARRLRWATGSLARSASTAPSAPSDSVARSARLRAPSTGCRLSAHLLVDCLAQLMMRLG